MRRVPHEDDIVAEIEDAVAAETGRAAGPLADAVDVDAVVSLFSGEDVDDMRLLTFRYGGCLVTVDCDAVTVEPIREAAAEPAPARGRNRG